jgi:hypothetical protein
MTPHELMATAADRINERARLGLPCADSEVLVTTPKGWRPPPRFPRRRIVQVKEDGTRVSYVNAVRVLAWCAAQLNIRVEFKGEVQ